MKDSATKLLRTFLASLAFTLGCVAEFLKWVAVVGCFLVLAASFVYFGFHLERATAHYAQGQRMNTLEALYGSVKWAAIVESTNKKLEAACEKLSKKQRKGLCPQES